jgi:hypothetical protein
MTKTTLLLALALLVTMVPRAEAAAFMCSGPIPDGECSDREMIGLDRAVDAEFDAIIEHAEPLTKAVAARPSLVRGDRHPRVHAEIRWPT